MVSYLNLWWVGPLGLGLVLKGHFPLYMKVGKSCGPILIVCWHDMIYTRWFVIGKLGIHLHGKHEAQGRKWYKRPQIEDLHVWVWEVAKRAAFGAFLGLGLCFSLWLRLANAAGSATPYSVELWGEKPSIRVQADQVLSLESKRRHWHGHEGAW